MPIGNNAAFSGAVPIVPTAISVTKQNLRVLFAATSTGNGGIERYSVRLASLLHNRGVEVAYACRPESFLDKHCAVNGIVTLPWNVKNSGDLKASSQLAHYVRDHAFDIVHVHSRRDYLPAALGTMGGRIHGLKLLLHAHLDRPLGDPPKLAGLFFRYATDGIIAVSDTVKQRLIAEHNFPSSFVSSLTNGVDLGIFPPRGSSESLLMRQQQRDQWGIPADSLVVGMVGRLNAKGQNFLFDVIPQLLKNTPNLYFVFAGPDGDGGDAVRLKDKASNAGIMTEVLVPGMVEDVAAAMAAIDLLVHLPADESFGLAPAEAMAAEIPVVATDIGGCREVVADKQTGLLVPLGDQQALVTAISFFLDHQCGETRRLAFGIKGRQRVSEEFSLEKQGGVLHRFYQSVVPQRL